MSNILPKHRYVAGFLLNTGMTEVILIEKLKPDWQKGKLNGVGGKIELGEAPEMAMTREFAEETGHLVPERHWHRLCLLHTVGNEATVDFFYAVRPGGELRECMSMEAEQIGIYDPRLPMANWVPNLRWLIPMAVTQNMGIDRAAWFHVYEVAKSL